MAYWVVVEMELLCVAEGGTYQVVVNVRCDICCPHCDTWCMRRVVERNHGGRMVDEDRCVRCVVVDLLFYIVDNQHSYGLVRGVVTCGPLVGNAVTVETPNDISSLCSFSLDI